MPKPSTLDLWDAAMGGEVIPLIVAMRQDGATYEQIAEAVRALGVKVSNSTVYRWCRQLTTEAVAS